MLVVAKITHSEVARRALEYYTLFTLKVSVGIIETYGAFIGLLKRSLD